MDDTKASLLLTRMKMSGSTTLSCIQDKFRTRLSEAIDLAENLIKSNEKLINHKLLISRLCTIGIYFDETEADYIRRRFANFRGDLSLKDIIETCDVGRPKEHVDPDHFVDTLPEPYRMITGINCKACRTRQSNQH